MLFICRILHSAAVALYATVSGVLGVVVVCQSVLPSNEPGYGNVNFSDAGLRKRAAVTAAIKAANWNVENYGIFLLATPKSSNEHTLVAHPFSNKKWEII